MTPEAASHRVREEPLATHEGRLSAGPRAHLPNHHRALHGNIEVVAHGYVGDARPLEPLWLGRAHAERFEQGGGFVHSGPLDSCSPLAVHLNWTIEASAQYHTRTFLF
jgi:hypothetical protein